MTIKPADVVKGAVSDMSAVKHLSHSDADTIKDVVATLYNELMEKAHDRLCPVVGSDAFVGAIPMLIAPVLVGLAGRDAHKVLLNVTAEKLNNGMDLDDILRTAIQLCEASATLSMKRFSMTKLPENMDDLAAMVIEAASSKKQGG